jgi:hypothetical protein
VQSIIQAYGMNSFRNVSSETELKDSDLLPKKIQFRTKYVLIKCVLASALVLAICELAARLWVFVDPPVRSGNQIFEEKLYVLQSIPAGKPIIFCMGDSKMNRAVYPDLLKSLLAEKGLDIEVANLSVDGAPLSLEKKLLTLASDHRIVPKILLYDLPITCLSTASPADVAKRKEALLKLTEKDESGLKFLNDTSFGRELLKKRTSMDAITIFFDNQSMLVKYRGHFKSRLKEYFSVVFNYPIYEMNTRKKVADYTPQVSMRGWNPNHTMLQKEMYEHLEPRMVTAQMKDQQIIDSLVPTHVAVEEYAAIQDFCTRHNICLAVVWLPHYAPFFDKYVFPSQLHDAGIAEKIRAADDPKNNLNTIVLDSANTDLKSFTDPWHINTYGAIETTRALSTVLSAAPYRKVISGGN